ncbi:hypothetical protein MLD38_032997 [Melastoma candidum]|uniref:Uncharacterized protein n=1 Tax=Melastoma candidum TaxID=119954 RepID=A0ACB9M7F2_9MYRT|nr:hypothetical protein MLD38_032997 [Melastoma candidum]
MSACASTSTSLFTAFSRPIQARSNRTPSSSRRPPNRSRNRSPRRTPLRTRGRPPARPVPPSDAATTYTSLPPKEDFLPPSLADASSLFPQVKLSEYDKFSEFGSREVGSEGDGLVESNLELGYVSLDVFGGNSGVDDEGLEGGSDSEEDGYVVLDVFEGNPDAVDADFDEISDLVGWEEVEDVEEEEEEEEDETVGEGQERGRIVTVFDSDGNKVTARMYTVGEDEDSEWEGDEDDETVGVGPERGRIVTAFDSDGNKVTARMYTVGEDDDLEWEGDAEDELGNKEKGLPAVMRCFDRAKIYVKAGDGGNGVVAFRREKFVPLGGPSGGDGGKGGDVYVEVDGSMNSLLPFRKSVHFRAGRGGHGSGKKQAGAKGDDVVIKVAPGTVIREAGKEDEVLLELVRPGQRALLLPGGRGGRGNASFKTAANNVPRIAENGEEGAEMWLELELKLVADVGIVGAPNAGKSTFLSVISAAQPAIASYPFTTLLPNLGVVSFDYDSTMVVADLPGLLEGAHRGFGLGHEFLRHTERCSALVHVVDGSSPQPLLEFDAVRLELEMFSPDLADKPYIVAYNKMDLQEACDGWPSFKESLEARSIKTFCMSAVRTDGTHQVISAAYHLLQISNAEEIDYGGWEDPGSLNHVAEKVKEQRNASINEFAITHESSTRTWRVTGSGLQRFVQMTNWRYLDSEKRFQHVLEACGVNKSLMKLGVKEGDTVIVGEMEMVWHDKTTEVAGAGR